MTTSVSSGVRNQGAPRSFNSQATVHRLHTVAGIFVAPLLLVAALTGLLYALAPSIENVYYHDALTSISGEPARPVAEQIEAAQHVHPDLSFAGVQVSTDPDSTTRVLFSDPSLPSASYKRAVFVDPGSLNVTGDLVQYGSSRALPLRAWISEGHRQLWLGEPGRIYSEMAASWLGILSLAGAWLWWARRNQRPSRGSRRQRYSRMHSLLGLWLLPGLLFLTVTGLTWSLVAGENIGQVRTQLSWVAPTPDVGAAAEPDAHAEHMGHAGHHAAMVNPADADRVIATARDAGLTGLLDATAPTEPGTAWTVKEAREAWRLPIDAVSVDGGSGELVDVVNFSEWPLAAKLTNWLIQMHMGTMFGLINQIVLAVLAVGLIAMICLGYAMWWRRGRGNRPGRLPSAGQWRRASPVAKVLLGLFLIVYSIIAPLFAASLLLFLAADALWQRLSRKTPRAAR